MRFDWMQDRARQKQFKVGFVSNGCDVSDFLPKPSVTLPVHVHQEMAPMHSSPPTPAALASCPVLFSMSPIVSDIGSTHLILLRHAVVPSFPSGTYSGRRPSPLSRDAHGHGPYPITNGERALLSAWLKQGRDWLML